MEKMNETNASKLFDTVRKSFDDVEVIKIERAGESFDIALQSRINLYDLMTLVDVVKTSAEIGEDRGKLFEKAILAKFIIEYLTDLPVPTITIDDEEVEDLSLCYEIVFGEGGLEHQSDRLSATIFNIERWVHNKEDKIKERPTEKLAEKILNYIELLNSEISDLNNNPAAMEDFINKITESLDTASATSPISLVEDDKNAN